MTDFSRRFLLAGTFSLSVASAFAEELEFNLRPNANFKPIRIAVLPFSGDPETARLFTNIVMNDFKHSSFLQPVDAKNIPDQGVNPDQPPMDALRAAGAQYALTGRVARDGKLHAEFRLWDVASGQQAAGEQFNTDAGLVRRVAHITSDKVFTRITSEGGFFDTRVIFIDETGPRENRRKRLAIMDLDGANVRYLTQGNELVLTPRISPSTPEVAYMSYAGSEPKVMLINLETHQQEAVGNFPGLSFAPRFSPDGQKIIMSLAEEGASSLYTVDLRSHAQTRLTEASAIDTSPSYSPDGRQIVFESDRGGTQQLYVMGANGGQAKRISFGDGGRYSTPVWSPKGDYIAFTRQLKGGFAIGVMKPDGSGERILTEGFHNEGPSWAPNGMFLMFFRDSGAGGSKIFMTDVYGHNEYPVPTPANASDPAWSPLIK